MEQEKNDNDKICILTVDDSRVVRKVVSAVIETLGYKAVPAENGQEALDKLAGLQPDKVVLVLLDWNMPVMDGMQCLKNIRASKIWGKLPVMMLTTESEKENILAAIANGASNYLTKPFRPEELATKILACLGKGL